MRVGSRNPRATSVTVMEIQQEMEYLGALDQSYASAYAPLTVCADLYCVGYIVQRLHPRGRPKSKLVGALEMKLNEYAR